MYGLNIAPPTKLVLPPAGVPKSQIQTWRDPNQVPFACSYSINGYSFISFPGLAQYRFSGGSAEVLAVPSPSAGMESVREAYCRHVLPLVMHFHGKEVLHASAVLTGGGVVAICAPSGTGKSTTAYGLSLRGYPAWADDAVAFECRDNVVECHSIPFKLRIDQFAESVLGMQAQPANSLKDPYELSSWASERRHLAALVLLERGDAERVTEETPEVVKLSPAQAFQAVLPHAYSFSLRDLQRRGRMLEQYLVLAQRVPVMRICFKPDLARLADLLDTIEHAIAPVPIPA